MAVPEPVLNRNVDWGRLAGLMAVLLGAAGVALVLAVIWVPWFDHNHLPEPRLEPGVIEEARRVPDDALLDELGSYDLYPSLPWADEQQLIKAAENLLQGKVELPGFESGALALPLDSAAMTSGSTMWLLYVHSLGMPRVWLDAYKAERRAEFLDAVAEYLVSYDAYERHGFGWSPSGWNDTWRMYVRNDHAVAARVHVLTEFWRLYRRSPGYRPDVAMAVFRMAARAAHLLADPARFTVATNHGVMQNLATCNIRLAFPSLPGVEDHCRLASRRLDEQLAFFINDEGFVLEHSPGYQGFSVRLVGIAFRYMWLSKLEIPGPWLQKYRAAQRVYAELRRPDGTFPVFGDTDGSSDGAGPVVADVNEPGQVGRPVARAWSPKNTVLLAPVAGYCLWWDGLGDWPDSRRLGQTAIAWSYFPGMGHKHADEMSLTVWAGGTAWWSNVGYWPYDVKGRELAESWDGANAPHLVGEPAESPRETHLRYHGREGSLAMIDLERHGPGAYTVRRQVIHVGQHLWIVIDTSSGAETARTRTVWTTSPAVRLTENPAGEGAYMLTDGNTGQALRAYFGGTPGTTLRKIEGSHAPFGGWSVVGGVVQPAPALVIEQPANGSWALASWSLTDATGSGPGLVGAPRMQRWEGAEDWEVMLPTADGPLVLRRQHGQISSSGSPGHSSSLEMAPGPDVSGPTAELRAALTSASEKYGTADMSGVYRLKVSVALLAVLLLNGIAVRLARRYRPAWAAPLGFMLFAGWMLLSGYFIFLRAQLV